MANTPDPVESLRKSLNAYVVAQEAMTQAAAEFKPAPVPPAETSANEVKPGGQ